MNQNYRTGLGVLLILAGLLMIGQQLGWIGGQWDEAILTLAFGAAGIFFLSLYLADRSRWWAAITTLVLLAIGASQLIEIFFPQIDGSFVGGGVLFLIGTSFILVYLLDRNMWWAIIPGSANLSLAAIVVADELIRTPEFETGGILILGLGLTFLTLYFLPGERENMQWALYPALPLLVFGLFVSLDQGELWKIVWPSLIILLGLCFILNSLRRG